ncbi:hypothetical protein [Flaviaesturariibacter amylovorans]|uniref:Serine protease n=1 Tax=Flaviaesturariibacter amylovorans TaxID=1084520 RepID=A0ABP8HHN5_9BACT
MELGKDDQVKYESAFEAEVWRLSTEHIHFHTVQFLEEGGPYGMKPVGTGVFVQILSRYFIFTASHVSEVATSKNLYINSGGKFILVQGYVRETDLEKYKYLDLSYIILEDGVGELLLNSYVPLQLSKIAAGHHLQETIGYVVLGYPEKNIRVEGSTVYAGSTTMLLAGAKQKVYDYYNFDRTVHLVLNYSGKATSLETGEKTKANSSPYGISGCGLWTISPMQSGDKLVCDYHLIGIMIQYRQGKYQILLGNRIELMMNAIQQFEGLQIGIYHPNHTS